MLFCFKLLQRFLKISYHRPGLTSSSSSSSIVLVKGLSITVFLSTGRKSWFGVSNLSSSSSSSSWRVTSDDLDPPVETEDVENDLVARENEREIDLDLDQEEKEDKEEEEPRSDCQENLSNRRRRSSSS